MPNDREMRTGADEREGSRGLGKSPGRKPWAWVCLAVGFVCGCTSGDPPGAREVPVSKPRPAASTADPNAAARPPRAIATH